VRALLAAAVIAMIACACGARAGQAGAPASASPASATASTGTADCVALGAIAPVTVSLLEIKDLGDGTRRVTSAEGGYSLVVPSAWRISSSHHGGPDPVFGQAHLSSFDPRSAPTPRPEAGTILPPDVGIRFDIEVWANLANEPVDVYAKRLHIGSDQVAVLPGSFADINGRRAYRTTIQDERRFQPATGPLVATRQTRAVWLVPSPRPDRVLVLYATPAESALLSVAERAVSTLEITMPARAVRPVTKQRSEILTEWLTGRSGPIAGRRVEAKLLTYAEAAGAVHGPPPGPNGPTPMGILRIDRDPEEWFWIVAVSGPDLPQGRGGPRGYSGTPAPTSWFLYTASATTDRAGGGTGAVYATNGTWPTYFDALPDRCN
jgi:hypothetical protein